MEEVVVEERERELLLENVCKIFEEESKKEAVLTVREYEEYKLVERIPWLKRYTWRWRHGFVH